MLLSEKDSQSQVETHILCRLFLACPTCRWRDTWQWACGAAGSRRHTGSVPPSGCRSGSAFDQRGRRCPRPGGLHTALEGRRGDPDTLIDFHLLNN